MYVIECSKNNVFEGRKIFKHGDPSSILSICVKGGSLPLYLTSANVAIDHLLFKHSLFSPSQRVPTERVCKYL